MTGFHFIVGIQAAGGVAIGASDINGPFVCGNIDGGFTFKTFDSHYFFGFFETWFT